jgi:hypothetical protein
MSSTEISLCDPYVWEDPRYIFRSLWIDRKKTEVCASEFVNKVILYYGIGLLVSLLVSKLFDLTFAPLLTLGMITLFLLPTFMKLRNIEGFRSIAGDSNSNSKRINPKKVDTVKSVNEPFVEEEKEKILEKTDPAKRNPFNNIMMDEYPNSREITGSPYYSNKEAGKKLIPDRPAASDITNPVKKVELDEFFRVQWFSDPTDVFGKSQSQRMFITQPVTTIPNDQDSYQNWLYKIPGKTCKEGNPANCYGGTDGSPMPWLNL